MPDYSRSEIVDILLVLGESRHNFRRAAQLYRQRFPDRAHHPNFSAIRFIEIRERRRVIRRVRRRRNPADCDDPRVLAVLAMVAIDPHISTREIQRRLGIPRSTASRILRNYHFHPYHITLTQALTDDDTHLRVAFCLWAQRKIRISPDFFLYVLFSDEATFHNTGQLNRHNCHYWSVENPHWHRQVDFQHRWSLNVWCGIINGYLVGPFFFPGRLNSAEYLRFLRDELAILLMDVDLNTRCRMWYQHDGAPAHWGVIVRNYLNANFQHRWIGRGGPVQWPARSPDLTSPDFFLWGFIKNQVYAKAPTTAEDMKNRIRNACRSIPRTVLLQTIESFKNRLRLCINEEGNVFEHLINS